MLQVFPYIHIDNQNDTIRSSGEAQETMEESILGQGNCNDMYCIEMDILTDNSFETSCEIEISSDEAYIDLDLQDKLDATEIVKIRSSGLPCHEEGYNNSEESVLDT